MESEKRKRQSNAVDDDENGDAARRTKPREDADAEDKPTTSTTPAVEAEVEEFFAILRRVHAVRYVQGDKGDESQSRKVTEQKNKSSHSQCWKPAFQWEDFEETYKGAKLREKRDEAAGAFDLNAAPKS